MELNRTVDEVAALTGGSVEGRGDRRLVALRGLERAGPDDLAAVFRDRGRARAADSAAGCLLVPADVALQAGPERSLVRVAEPLVAVEQLVAAWGPVDPVPPPGVHPSAVVEPGAEVAADAVVGPGVVIGGGARVGARCRLGPGVVLGAGVALGEDVVLHAHVVIGPRCRLGDRVTVHPGAVIGSDGFGYRMEGGRQVKIAQVGTVIVGDDVSVGANCTIDRARFDATVIGDGCKLDDQVHIGHNCVLGEACAIAGNTALGGSTVLGDRVLVGGGSGIRDGVRLGSGAMVGGCSLVTKDVAAGEFVAGHPARPHARWRREQAALGRLAARGGSGADGGDARAGEDARGA